ncbi:DUF4350 domain-containing protein [Burkholderiaceae bacterium UC74_6]
MNRDRVIWLLTAIGLALGAWWLQANTEWVDEEQPTHTRGEALRNPLYVAEQLLRRLQMQVEHHEALDQLPPPGARLVMLSDEWQLLPGKAQQLQQWVEQGGHLVLPITVLSDDSPFAQWLPIDAQARPKKKAAAEPPGQQPAASGTKSWTVTANPPLWGEVEQLKLCGPVLTWQRLLVKRGSMANWTLMRDDGLDAVRVQRGQGSVTLLNVLPAFFEHPAALRCDAPLFIAAAVQAEPGAKVWFYLNEKREPLLPWLWHTGWIAIVTAGLALAALMWRATLRFGPRLATAPRLRRSIAEQVRGTGNWLQRHGREALLAAQLRALEDTAARVLPHYRRLGKSDRVRAIAAATGLAPEPLAVVFNEPSCKRAELPERLRLMESTRRRLLLNKSPAQERTAP